MGPMKNFFAGRWGIIGVGAFIGVLAPLIVSLVVCLTGLPP